MLFRDNPVLTRELLVTLRSPRSFVLQLLYVCAWGPWSISVGRPARKVLARSVRASPGGFTTFSSLDSSFWWP